MKIFYVAFKYDYADPRRGFSYEHANFWDTLSRMYGRDVNYFPMDEKIIELGRSGMNKALLAAVKREKPDIFFSTLFTNEIKPKTIREITEKTNTITVNWFSDDQWRFENFSRFWAPCFDWVITTDPEAPLKYKKIGYGNVIRTTWAANHFTYRPLGSGLRYDVSFVGRPHSSRREIITSLARHGIRVACFGEGWPRGRISQEEMIKIFGESRVNLNFTEVSATKRDLPTIFKAIAKIFLRRGIKNSHHFFSPSIIVRNIITFHLPSSHPQIKGRNFEVPACGGFLLTQPAEDLDHFYDYDKEIALFQNEGELVEKIHYYLTHEEERKRIARAGYQRTLRDHTWERRFSEIFGKILTSGKRKSLQ